MGREREEREKKAMGAAFPNNKKSFPRPWLVRKKHQFGRPVKMLQTSWPLDGIRHKADAVKPQIPKPRPKLSVPTTSSKAFCFQDQGNVS